MASSTLSHPPKPHNICNRPIPYLIITNISKRQNIKNLLQLAAAYGCCTIFVVGQRAFQFDVDDIESTADGDGGDESRSSDIPPMLQNGIRNGKMKIVKFDKLEECVQHIKSIPCNDTSSSSDSKKTTTIPILGVEIDNASINLEEEPFTSSTAFMMGNEGSGMTKKQMSVCDGFIRIPQYGGGTGSLNVSVAAALVLHRFHHWSRKVSEVS